MQTFEARVLYDTGYVLRPFTFSDIQAKSKEDAAIEAKWRVLETLKNDRAAHPEYIKNHLTIDYVAAS
jgi:hypothetical protein